MFYCDIASKLDWWIGGTVHRSIVNKHIYIVSSLNIKIKRKRNKTPQRLLYRPSDNSLRRCVW